MLHSRSYVTLVFILNHATLALSIAEPVSTSMREVENKDWHEIQGSHHDPHSIVAPTKGKKKTET